MDVSMFGPDFTSLSHEDRLEIVRESRRLRRKTLPPKERKKAQAEKKKPKTQTKKTKATGRKALEKIAKSELEALLLAELAKRKEQSNGN